MDWWPFSSSSASCRSSSSCEKKSCERKTQPCCQEEPVRERPLSCSNSQSISSSSSSVLDETDWNPSTSMPDERTLQSRIQGQADTLSTYRVSSSIPRTPPTLHGTSDLSPIHPSASHSSCPYHHGHSSSSFSASSLSSSSSTSSSSLSSTSCSDAATSVACSGSLGTDPSIPASTWLYPSPQMFYHALKRKGHETDPKDIDMMVHIHNDLNENVWQEVLNWEKQVPSKGLCPKPSLKRFRGRPTELSPKARFCTTFLGSPSPFDRHDWTVDRCGQEVRYVIDYYAGPNDPDGSPTFFVDVRPALDRMGAFRERLSMAWQSYFGSSSISSSH